MKNYADIGFFKSLTFAESLKCFIAARRRDANEITLETALALLGGPPRGTRENGAVNFIEANF